MVGRRRSVGRASLVASVLLLVLSSLPLLVLSCLPLLLPHLRSANVRFLGNSSLRGPPLRTHTLSCKGFVFKTTGLARSPTAVTVVSLLPRLQLRSIRSRSGRSCWPWRLSYGQWVKRRQCSVLRNLLLRRSNQIRRARRGLPKASNAAKNAVAQKTNQHAAMVDKVDRWSVELEKARQKMLDLAVEVYDAEQAERKARGIAMKQPLRS